MMHVLLVTTCDMASGRLSDFERLTNSLAASVQPGLSIVHLVLMQRASAADVAPLVVQSLPFSRVLLYSEGRLSLAAARNALLRTALDEGLLDIAQWVAFPDDDAWYPTGLVTGVSQAFATQPGLAVVTCRYGSQPIPTATGDDFKIIASPQSLVSIYSSNTLFVRSAALRAAGIFFDERLGLGATINGGEDLDYALRLVSASGGMVAFCDQTRVGHRDRVAWVRSRYFEGSLCALARGAAQQSNLLPLLVRKLFVGLALVAKRELRLTQFSSGLVKAAEFWRNAVFVQADPQVILRVQRTHRCSTPISQTHG